MRKYDVDREVTHKIGWEVEFVELVGRLQQAGDQGGHQHLLPQLVDVRGPPLAAGHLHCPPVRVGDDAHRLRYGLVQHRVLKGSEGWKERNVSQEESQEGSNRGITFIPIQFKRLEISCCLKGTLSSSGYILFCIQTKTTL